MNVGSDNVCRLSNPCFLNYFVNRMEDKLLIYLYFVLCIFLVVVVVVVVVVVLVVRLFHLLTLLILFYNRMENKL